MKYSIGLDIGVSSVGWACMKSDYSIPKYNGRYAMGVREFEAAQTAEERRIQRGTRRRYNRRIKRIQLIQETLAPLFKDDPNFIINNNEKESHFWKNSNEFEHKSLSEVLNELGENKRKYPTIYHLRKSLMEENKAFNPRLIYLAIHHLTKYRGHFLNENMNWSEQDNTSDLENKIIEYFILTTDFGYPEIDIKENVKQIIEILQSDQLTKSDKRNEIKKLTHKDFQNPISLLVGLNANAATLFSSSDNVEQYKAEKVKLDLTKEEIVESYEKLTDEEQGLIDSAHIIYQEIILHDLLGNSTYVAEAKVKTYKQFRKDLTQLQAIYNEHFSEKEYREMFITPTKNMTEYNETKNEKLLSKFDQFTKLKSKYEEAFYTDLIKQFKELLKGDLTEVDKVELKDVVFKLENNQFLEKQKGKMNAAIPHQNNVYEAVTILKNQQAFYPEITNEMIQRVEQIISFRIPYYVGPLVKEENKGEFGWVKRNDDQTILPWNFDQIVNRSESAESFITRMTNTCTYLLDEKVLPKHSLVYQEFEVLNELNGIQIRTEQEQPSRKYRLDEEVKLWLIENVFKKYKSVTHKRLMDALKVNFPEVIQDHETGELKQVYGTQAENKFNTALSSWIDMKAIFGEVNDANFKMIEEIIYWISVFEDKSIIEIKLKESYPELNPSQIRSLLSKSYTGWGRLSKKLLSEIAIDQVSGESFIDLMKRERKGFMEILHEDKYDLENRIAEMNKVTDKTYKRIRYQDINALHGSPALKKGIWQAVKVVEELVDIFGEPEHIMLEFAREDQVSRRTVSRKKRLADAQKAISRTEKDLKDFLKTLNEYDEQAFNNNRLYLYFTQEGKCLYSGETLDVTKLHLYEVDHILPQSFVKDDSLDNLALVKKEMNQKKAGTKMPLEILTSEQKVKQRLQWKKLFENKLISQRKYYRLLKESFNDQDKESFFARQLVETRQITKHVKDLFEERFDETEIHTVNANIVTNLRKHSQAFKIRELNNKHHAVDAAFTNLVVQFIMNQYGKNFLNFNFKYQEANKKWREMMMKYKKNFFLFGDIDKSNVFKHYKTNKQLTGREYLMLINDEMPWQTTKKIGSSEAAFYKETLYSPKAGPADYKSDKTSIGIHKGLKNDSSYLISYSEKRANGKTANVSTIVNLRVIEKYQLQGVNAEEKALFLAEKVAKNQVIDAVIHSKIPRFQTVLVNNHKFNFISDGEMNNGKQLVLDKSILREIYALEKSKSEVSIDFLQELFKQISVEVIKQYQELLPKARVKRLTDFTKEIDSFEVFNKGLQELFKVTRANADRSDDYFGGRYERKLNVSEARFVYESITGLRYRKPKSFKNELWAK